MDEIGDMFARIHAACLLTEVSATAKRTILVNRASSVFAEATARSVSAWLKLGSASGSYPCGSVQCLHARYAGCSPGELEVAAATTQLTRAR